MNPPTPTQAANPAENDAEDRIRNAISATIDSATPLRLQGGGSKAFYGPASSATSALDLRPHRGIINYQPTELAVTVRAGTPLAELQAALTAEGQQLSFEPPAFSAQATVGGMLAAGLSGPRRPWGGAVRDAVLGVRIINGRGEALSFGGQVMKNVAGYDLSRLMAGSMGTLGVILHASFKVLPAPAHTASLSFELNASDALHKMRAWARQSLPITASCHHQGRLSLRLQGGEQAIAAAVKQLGGETGDASLWQQLREQQLPFFQTDRPLWRLSLPPATPHLDAIDGNIDGDWLLEWSGAQRWLTSQAAAETIRATASSAGGHATLFRPGDCAADTPRFTPLSPPLLHFHRQLKQAMDPHGLLNPGRLYAEF